MAETVEDRISKLEEKVAKLENRPTATGKIDSALERRLEKHGIRLQPEDADEAQGSGSEKYGASDWTAAGRDADGFPVPKGSAEDVTVANLPTQAEADAAAAKE